MLSEEQGSEPEGCACQLQEVPQRQAAQKPRVLSENRGGSLTQKTFWLFQSQTALAPGVRSRLEEAAAPCSEGFDCAELVCFIYRPRGTAGSFPSPFCSLLSPARQLQSTRAACARVNAEPGGGGWCQKCQSELPSPRSYKIHGQG